MKHHTFFLAHQPPSHTVINPTTSLTLTSSTKRMRTQKAMVVVVGSMVLLLWWGVAVTAEVDCSTVTGLVMSCSTFITYGSPDPLPGSPCCDAMMSLNLMAESGENRRSVCKCFMGLVTSHHTNATAIATLPGFCGVSLGFVIDPTTDCSFVL